MSLEVQGHSSDIQELPRDSSHQTANNKKKWLRNDKLKSIPKSSM